MNKENLKKNLDFLLIDLSLEKIFLTLVDTILENINVDAIILHRIINKDNRVFIKRIKKYINEKYNHIKAFWDSLESGEFPIENSLSIKDHYLINKDKSSLTVNRINDPEMKNYLKISMSDAKRIDTYSFKRNNNIIALLQLIWFENNEQDNDVSEIIKYFNPYMEISLKIRELEEKENNFNKTEETYKKLLNLTATINKIDEKELYSHILINLNQIFGFDMIFTQIEENGLLPIDEGAVIESNFRECLEKLTQMFGKNGSPPVINPPEMANCIVFTSKMPIYFKDINSIKNLPMREKDKIAIESVEKIINIKSVLILPILEKGKAVGVAQLWSFNNSVDITTTEISMLKDLFSLIPSIKRNYLLHKEVEEKNKILEEKNRFIKNINNQIKKELQIANKIQQSLIVKNIPKIEGLKISSIYKPMEELGGDFYDITNIQNKIIGIFISDVSGHGVPAALVTMILKSIIDNAGIKKLRPKELIEDINKKIVSYNTGQFLTAFYGLYNSANKKLTYVKASHPEPILIRDGKIIKLGGKGKILGMLEDINVEEKVIELQKNDKLIFYTDGLTEAINQNKDMFEDTFYKIIECNYQLKIEELIDKIYFNLLEFCETYDLEDDVCLIGIEIIN
ncbi:MAG TPA: PP2C family protein-serine/threonine phosphatase [Spirochaetota bacterium]|nr:PP2C family protein-serine/threonine phosphatase [Spirochaetota bacterium]